MSREPVRVCFVCLGNICRSPTAEGVMRWLADRTGHADWIEIESAGTAAHHVGERADRRARAAAARRGIALPSRARAFEASDFDRLDYVLAMDEENLVALDRLRRGRRFEGHLGLLRAFDPLAPEGAVVPDPYYGGPSGFETVLDLCEAACRGLLERLIERHGVR
ncbi:MAG: low molecular weight phosphotyrosine protein phosphatase [Spirochaetaceae bacterium]|nr:low molecular weight phosphotyrosine protein phosphatase [Myxococcales bacterium]MCB9723644.1 low molecular weight phosphotyrosine protein phosphatase [Spirochaetaceae bacterium]HPG27898.1 low molecular weight protein-tyrosine-phosphatase [Myxococcota bacterium]